MKPPRPRSSKREFVSSIHGTACVRCRVTSPPSRLIFSSTQDGSKHPRKKLSRRGGPPTLVPDSPMRAGIQTFSLVLSSALALGCSDDGSPNDAGSALGGQTGIVVSPGGGALGSGGNPSNPTPGTCGVSNDLACVEESYEGESVPLDIYILFDQSGSMCSCLDPPGGQLCPDPSCRETRLDAVRKATGLFLEDPRSAGIGVGLTFFGKQPIGQASCEVSEYRSAAVDIGLLPAHAPAIQNALASIAPTGETPTAAAIRGACEYAVARKRAVPQRELVILLLTDGKPEAPRTCLTGTGPCCPTLDDAVSAAAECRGGNPGVRTYVLGVGDLLQNLEQIAIAGGSERAYLVEGGNVSEDVLKALNQIRGDAAIPCEMTLPEPPGGQTLAYDQVNVEYQDESCSATQFYYVESADRCGTNDGWHYDNPQSPERILLCPSSCERVGAPGGRLAYTVGCATRVVPR